MRACHGTLGMIFTLVSLRSAPDWVLTNSQSILEFLFVRLLSLPPSLLLSGTHPKRMSMRPNVPHSWIMHQILYGVDNILWSVSTTLDITHTYTFRIRQHRMSNYFIIIPCCSNLLVPLMCSCRLQSQWGIIILIDLWLFARRGGGIVWSVSGAINDMLWEEK